MQLMAKQDTPPHAAQGGIGPEGGCGSALIRLEFSSGEQEVRAALGELKDMLAGVALSDDDRGTVELVLGEVLNNVVEHAYGPERIGNIRINCRVRPDTLSFCVCDSGRAMEGLKLPSGTPPSLDCARDDLPEGGFGWFLVRSLATRLRYARRGMKNFFRFDIPFDQDAARRASAQEVARQKIGPKR